MWLRKRGKKYSIVWKEDGKTIYKSTGMTSKEEAEKVLSKERRKLERRLNGLPPVPDDPNLPLIEAIEGFMHCKRRLSKEHRKGIRNTLYRTAYEAFKGRNFEPCITESILESKIKPFLANRRLVDLVPEVLEPWIDDQFDHGKGSHGHQGASYTTVMVKIRMVREMMDYWYRRKKKIPENPLDRLDIAPKTEVPGNTCPRGVRRSFEVEEAVAFFEAVRDLDRVRNIRLVNEKRTTQEHRFPVLPIFRAALATGARTSEVLTTPVHEVVLSNDPHFWIPHGRCKTGIKGERKATIHPSFATELKEYREKYRLDAEPDDPFFIVPGGVPLDRARLLDHFYDGVYLAFVRLELERAEIRCSFDTQRQVAFYIQHERVCSPGGSRLRAETIQCRLDLKRQVKELAGKIMLGVRKRLIGIVPYSMRHTHGTWAADQEVSEVHISKQLGHVTRGTTGRYISKKSMKLIDPRKSSHGVWNLLTKAERDRRDTEPRASSEFSAGA